MKSRDEARIVGGEETLGLLIVYVEKRDGLAKKLAHNADGVRYIPYLARRQLKKTKVEPMKCAPTIRDYILCAIRY